MASCHIIFTVYVSMYSTAQRQNHSYSYFIERVAFDLINQFVVACAKSSVSVLYA